MEQGRLRKKLIVPWQTGRKIEFLKPGEGGHKCADNLMRPQHQQGHCRIPNFTNGRKVIYIAASGKRGRKTKHHSKLRLVLRTIEVCACRTNVDANTAHMFLCAENQLDLKRVCLYRRRVTSFDSSHVLLRAVKVQNPLTSAAGTEVSLCKS